MKHSYCSEYGDVLLRPLHRYDIEYLRQWRNRKELNRFLRDIGEVTPAQQEQWFESYMQNTDILHFVIDYRRKRTIGSVALYGFSDKICQIGKLMIGEADMRGNGLGRRSFLMAMTVAVKCLGIEEFYLSVHEDNIIAKNIYDSIGFRKAGEHPFWGGGIEVDMAVTKSRFFTVNQEIKEINLFSEDGNSLMNAKV